MANGTEGAGPVVVGLTGIGRVGLVGAVSAGVCVDVAGAAVAGAFAAGAVGKPIPLSDGPAAASGAIGAVAD